MQDESSSTKSRRSGTWLQITADCKLSWALQQHDLALVLKITSNCASCMQHASKQMQWPAVMCTGICSPLWFHLHHCDAACSWAWTETSVAPDSLKWWWVAPYREGKIYFSHLFCLHQVSFADFWVEPGRGWVWESPKWLVVGACLKDLPGNEYRENSQGKKKWFQCPRCMGLFIYLSSFIINKQPFIYLMWYICRLKTFAKAVQYFRSK